MNQSFHSPEELRDLAAAHGIVATLHPAGRPMPTVAAAAAAWCSRVRARTSV